MTNATRGELRARGGSPLGAQSRRGWRDVLHGRAMQRWWTMIAFGVLFIAFSVWLGSTFLTVQGRILDIHSNVPILLMALAVLTTLTVGQFDLSVAGTTTLSAYLTVGMVVLHGWPMGAAIALAIAAGLVAGIINAVLVVKVGVNAFIATLGTSGIFLGASAVFSGGGEISSGVAGGTLPNWFTHFGAFTGRCPAWLGWAVVAALGAYLVLAVYARRPARIGPRMWAGLTAAITVAVGLALEFGLGLNKWVNYLTWAVFILLVVTTAMWILLKYTGLGRSMMATGSNREAARLAGIATGRVTVFAFILGSVIAAVAGVIVGANLGAASPDVAADYLLPAFAAAFLSTVLFSNGHFNPWGTVVGGVFIIWVRQGLVSGGLPFTWSDIINGVVLIAAVALSSVFGRERRHRH
jgi:ribose/xylose/arabinose/galactoside ABC-type transport system permease subunit